MVFDNLSKEEISVLSKFIVLHAFRNSPIENIHEDGRIKQDEMRLIMQSAVTHVAAIINSLMKEKGAYTKEKMWKMSEITNEWDDPDWDMVDRLMKF